MLIQQKAFRPFPKQHRFLSDILSSSTSFEHGTVSLNTVRNTDRNAGYWGPSWLDRKDLDLWGPGWDLCEILGKLPLCKILGREIPVVGSWVRSWVRSLLLRSWIGVYLWDLGSWDPCSWDPSLWYPRWNAVSSWRVIGILSRVLLQRSWQKFWFVGSLIVKICSRVKSWLARAWARFRSWDPGSWDPRSLDLG